MQIDEQRVPNYGEELECGWNQAVVRLGVIWKAHVRHVVRWIERADLVAGDSDLARTRPLCVDEDAVVALGVHDVVSKRGESGEVLRCRGVHEAKGDDGAYRVCGDGGILEQQELGLAVLRICIVCVTLKADEMAVCWGAIAELDVDEGALVVLDDVVPGVLGVHLEIVCGDVDRGLEGDGWGCAAGVRNLESVKRELDLVSRNGEVKELRIGDFCAHLYADWSMTTKDERKRGERFGMVGEDGVWIWVGA